MIETTEQPREFLTAEWRHILMLTFEVPQSLLMPHVPRGLELDLWRGKAFVTVVGLYFVTKTILGIPLSFLPAFEQVNLRFYVRRTVSDQAHRGVVFLKEVVPRYLVTATAKLLFKQNYVTCPMRHGTKITFRKGSRDEEVEYAWLHRAAWHRISVQVRGAFKTPAKGSREEFVVERYTGYVLQNRTVKAFNVKHPPWKVMQAETGSVAEINEFYGPELAPYLRAPTFAFLAEGGAAKLYHPLTIG